MLELLLFTPLAAGAVMFIPGAWPRRLLLLLTAVAHIALASVVFTQVNANEKPAALGGLLEPDALGVVFLMIASILFLATACYSIGYLKQEEKKEVRRDIQ
ncbi:MAG: NADH dehydrogenase FAD-containing subunit, partial [Desulfovibrio sp.]|nr:NADH dehydrogenase FAD-containing subunit [Desulfovibrio sp.]